MEDKKYLLNVDDMYDAWSTKKKDIKKHFQGGCLDNKNCAFRGIFGGDGSTYVSEWIISDGVVSRTVLAMSEDVIHLFMTSKYMNELDIK